MKIAISGSRKGVDEYQIEQFKKIIKKLLRTEKKLEIVHGCTIGAEYTLHNILLEFEKEYLDKIRIIGAPGYPPGKPQSSHAIAECNNLTIELISKEFSERNVMLANTCDILFAFPGDRVRLGNVWDTISKFRKIDKKVILFERMHFKNI